MADLIWLHEEGLRRTHPIFARAEADSPAVFVWDQAYFKAAHIGLKRQIFIYESLIDLPVDICAGTHKDVITGRIRADRVTRLLVLETPNTLLNRTVVELRQACPHVAVEIVADTPFVTLEREPDLGRFFHYWTKAKKSALCHGGLR